MPLFFWMPFILLRAMTDVFSSENRQMIAAYNARRIPVQKK